MKKYKIGDRIIHADSIIDAVKIMKQTMKDDASKYATIMALIEDEKAAVEAYNVAIRNLEGQIPDESLAAIKAIRDDENRHIENLMAVVNGNVTQKNLEDSTKDMPLSFRSNVDMSALKSNVANLKANPKNVNSLTSNLESINADRIEWHKFDDDGTFKENANLKAICKNLAKAYITELNKVSDVDSTIRDKINRTILNLSADLTNIF